MYCNFLKVVLNILMIYISGDNILTAISVAKECGIIEPGETVVEVSAEEENNSNPAQVLFTSSGNLLSVR